MSGDTPRERLEKHLAGQKPKTPAIPKDFDMAEWTPPERPVEPGPKATPAERAAHAQAMEDYAAWHRAHPPELRMSRYWEAAAKEQAEAQAKRQAEQRREQGRLKLEVLSGGGNEPSDYLIDPASIASVGPDPYAPKQASIVILTGGTRLRVVGARDAILDQLAAHREAEDEFDRLSAMEPVDRMTFVSERPAAGQPAEGSA